MRKEQITPPDELIQCDITGCVFTERYIHSPIPIKHNNMKGNWKRTENHILGHNLSIFHSWLKLRCLVAVSSAFSGQNWSEVTVVFLLIFHYTWFSRKRHPAKVSVKCQWNKARSHVDQWISTKSWTDPELLVFFQ